MLSFKISVNGVLIFIYGQRMKTTVMRLTKRQRQIRDFADTNEVGRERKRKKNTRYIHFNSNKKQEPARGPNPDSKMNIRRKSKRLKELEREKKIM